MTIGGQGFFEFGTELAIDTLAALTFLLTTGALSVSFETLARVTDNLGVELLAVAARSSHNPLR